MLDWYGIITWFLYTLPSKQIYRWHKGGLWINFKDGQWVQTTWIDKEAGYISNKFDGGVFHTSFKLIVKIEDYT